MKPLLLPAALALGLLAQCHRADPMPPPAPDPLTLLPAETQTGTRTFGCLVNGKAYATTTTIEVNGDWQSPTTIFIGGNARESGSLNGDFFSVGLLLNGNLQGSQTFALVPFTKNTSSSINEFVVNANILATNCNYNGNYVRTGQLTLTKFDGVARIAAGRFAFTLYQPGGCDTLRVTNGRFDVRF